MSLFCILTRNGITDTCFSIHGLKSIGYVELIVPESSYISPKRTSKRSADDGDSDVDLDADLPSSPRSSYLPAVIIGAIVLAAAFSIPYLSSAPSSK